MPLFGKKKSSTGDGAAYPKQQKPAYPVQQPANPVQQPAYPVQQPAQQQPGTSYQPPPPYNPGPSYPSQPPVVQPVVQPYPVTTQYPILAQSSVPQPIVPPDQTAVGVYDQGARFDPNKRPSLPPPPPGVAPTQAQMAAAQGQTVAMSQQKKDTWGMGSDGGVAFF